MGLVERIVSELVKGCCHLVELERRLMPYKSEIQLLNTLLASSLEAATKVDEFVKKFINDLEAYKRCGQPDLEYVDEIKWATGELIFHLKSIHRFLALVDNTETQELGKIVQQAILELEALLGAVLVQNNLRESLEAEVRGFES